MLTLVCFRVRTERSKDLTELGQSLFCQPRTVFSHFNEDSFSFRPKEVLKWAVTRGCLQRAQTWGAHKEGNTFPSFPEITTACPGSVLSSTAWKHVWSRTSSLQMLAKVLLLAKLAVSTQPTLAYPAPSASPSYLVLLFQNPNQGSLLRPSRLSQTPFLLDLCSIHFFLYTLL